MFCHKEGEDDSAAWSYGRWDLSFLLGVSSRPALYTEFFGDDEEDDDWWERQSRVTAALSLPLNFVESSLSLSAGYRYEERRALTSADGRTVGGLEVFEGRRDSIFAGLDYSGALKYPYSVGFEEGRNVGLLFRSYSRSLGGDLDQREYSADWEEFVGLWANHNLRLRLAGATADGDRIAQQAFQLGGVPAPGTDWPLRGFSQGFETGRHIVTGTVEYRFPLFGIFRGWNTKPLFFEKMNASLFSDAGSVWGVGGEGFDWEDVRVGVGTEIRLDMTLGYSLKISPAMGIAQGVTDDGETQVYFIIYVDL